MSKIKALIISSVSIMLLAGSAVVALAAVNPVNQNASAIESEPIPGNVVDCFSQSKVNEGYTYYDCGFCQKTVNAEGKGNKRTCVANSGTIVIVVDPIIGQGGN